MKNVNGSLVDAQQDIDELLGVLAMLARNIRTSFRGAGVITIVADAHKTLDRLAARCSPDKDDNATL